MEKVEWTEKIYGIECRVVKEGKQTAYTFTVPGWAEVTVTGLANAKRTIRGRTNPAVINTMGAEWCAKH